ncbi:MAG TPA: copper-binding protein [Methylophilaceae bacterium]
MKKSIFMAVMLSMISFTAISYAEDMKMDMPAAKADMAKPITGKGVVVSENKSDGSVILKHEAIPAIGWGAMTMPFKVKDKMLLDHVQKGDKVQFTLEQQGKDYVITSIK